MNRLICPQCGRPEPDPNARFCDLDGAQLVQESTSPANSKPPSAGGVALAPSLLAGLGALTLLAAGWLHFHPAHSALPATPAPPDDLPSAPQAASANSPSSPPRTEASPSAKLPDVASSSSPLTTTDLLKRCYGDIPAIPPARGGEEAQAFEVAKEVLRTGTEAGSDAAAPNVTLADQQRAGDQVARAMKQRFAPLKDDGTKHRIDAIVARLTPNTLRDREFHYAFTILNTDDLNAFMAPAGRGFVTRGILVSMPVDDQVTFVLGHELAHGELGHGDSAVRIGLAGRELGHLVLGSGGEDIGEGLSSLSERILSSSYDQDQEFEADRLGLCLAYLAGADRASGAAAIGTLAASSPEARNDQAPSGGGQRIAYDVIATHPPLPERIAYLKNLQNRLGSRR